MTMSLEGISWSLLDNNSGTLEGLAEEASPWSVGDSASKLLTY